MKNSRLHFLVPLNRAHVFAHHANEMQSSIELVIKTLPYMLVMAGLMHAPWNMQTLCLPKVLSLRSVHAKAFLTIRIELSLK